MTPLRPFASASLIALALATPAFADDPPAPGAVTFTPGAALVAGVTFTPGPVTNANVTFTPGPAPANGVTFTPGREGDDPAPIAVTERESPPDAIALPAPLAVAPVALTHAASEPEARVEPAVIPPPAREEPGAYGCRMSGPIARVDLAASDSLRAVQVALATRGDEAVALVTLARAGGPRDGMVFPESRLVTLPADGRAASVVRAEGFEPDTAIALGADGNVLALGYTHASPGQGDAGRSLRIALLSPRGQSVATAHALPDSVGLTVDSAPIALGAGYAVILGRGGDNADGTAGPAREWLYTLDAQGTVAHAPVLVTDAQSDDTLSRYRVGLGAVPPAAGGSADELAVGWTSAQGEVSGVLARRVRDGELLPAVRVSSRPAWGAEISHDGTGVMFRTDGARGTPSELWFQRWDAAQPERVGAGWDPAVAFVRGKMLVAGVTLLGPDGGEVPTLVGVAIPGQPMRAVVAGGDSGTSLEHAVDYDLAATDRGAVLAWIESARDPSSPALDVAGARRLAVARVVCER